MTRHLNSNSATQAGGNSGSFMAKCLIDTGKFTVTAISRPDSKSSLPDGIKVARADNDDHAALVAALKGQDALIITLSVTAPADTSEKLIRAAAEAEVPWILPNEWSPDTEVEGIVNDVPGFQKGPEARSLIKELGKSSYLAVATGFWYEWSLAIPSSYGFDITNKSVTLFDEGKTPISTSTWPQVGRAVAALLSLPIKPEDGNKEQCLKHFKDSLVYVNSFTLTQNDMLESILRVTGGKREDWSITKEPARERWAKAVEAVKGGERMAYVRQMYTRIFFDDGNGNYEKSRGVANEILGLPKEDLDEATTRAIKRAAGDDARAVNELINNRNH